MTTDVDGLDTLLKRLESLKKTGKVAVLRSAIRGGLNVIGKQMKQDLDPKAKQGKTAVKSRFKKGKTKITALVGFGVGKKSKKAPKVVNRKGNRKAGVGISAQNVHWWVAGTKKRSTGFIRGKATGKPIMDRGEMPAMQPRLARIAYAKSKGQINAEMINRGALQLNKEVAKLQKVK